MKKCDRKSLDRWVDVCGGWEGGLGEGITVAKPLITLEINTKRASSNSRASRNRNVKSAVSRKWLW